MQIDGGNIWASMNRPIAPRRSQVKAAGTLGRTDAALAAWLGTGATSSSKRIGKVALSERSISTAPQDKALAGWLGSGKQSSGGKTEHKEVSAPDDAAAVAAGDPIAKVVRLEDVVSKPESLEDGKRPKVQGTGLEQVLSAIKGDKGPGVLDKTRNAWSTFKRDDVEVADELEAYKKDKNRYTDKVAFLDRTELREWEADMERKRRR
jgi:hypothetical protein